MQNFSPARLREALRYSGLITDESTYDEILDALAAYFPEIKEIYVIRNGVTDYALSGSFEKNSGFINFSLGSAGGAEPGYINGFKLPVGKYIMHVEYGVGGMSGYTPYGYITLPDNASPMSFQLPYNNLGKTMLSYDVNVVDYAAIGNISLADSGAGVLRIYNLYFLKG